MKEKQSYGLVTIIATIVGVVIGSGIYFKSDDILVYTNGDVLLGILVLSIGAISIIFGALTLSELSKRTATPGGMTGYFETFVSNKFAAGYGWFQLFMHIPSLVVVVAWVSAIYTFIIFGVDATLEWQILLGLGYIAVFVLLNLISKKLSGYFQTVTTIIKLLPLISIAIAGLFWGKDVPELPQGVTKVTLNYNQWGWLSALVPLAFAYDGWTVSLAIAPEVKNPLKNVTKSLIISPLIILCTYLLFFVGITRILGSDFIISTGNSAVTYAVEAIFGQQLSKLLTIFITISILGVLNGLILSGICLPQALVEKNMLTSGKLVSRDTTGLSVKNTFFFFIICCVWLTIHYFTQKYNVLLGRDVSEISVVFNYLCCIILYVTVFKLYTTKKTTNKLTGMVSPILAILGALLILIGSLLSSFVYSSLFIGVCCILVALGYYYYKTLYQYREDKKYE